MKKHKSKILSSYKPGLLLWLMGILFSLIPASINKLGIAVYLMPQIELSLIFFASIYLKISPISVFLYGLFIDVAYGRPMGITALILMLIYFIIGKMRTKLENISYSSIILYFLYCMIIVKILELVILSIYYSSNIVPYYSELIINIFVNVIFYILLHKFLYNRIYSKHYEN